MAGTERDAGKNFSSSRRDQRGSANLQALGEMGGWQWRRGLRSVKPERPGGGAREEIN
jgi:hypothetical protein